MQLKYFAAFEAPVEQCPWFASIKLHLQNHFTNGCKLKLQKISFSTIWLNRPQYLILWPNTKHRTTIMRTNKAFEINSLEIYTKWMEWNLNGNKKQNRSTCENCSFNLEKFLIDWKNFTQMSRSYYISLWKLFRFDDSALPLFGHVQFNSICLRESSFIWKLRKYFFFVYNSASYDFHKLSPMSRKHKFCVSGLVIFQKFLIEYFPEKWIEEKTGLWIKRHRKSRGWFAIENFWNINLFDGISFVFLHWMNPANAFERIPNWELISNDLFLLFRMSVPMNT